MHDGNSAISTSRLRMKEVVESVENMGFKSAGVVMGCYTLAAACACAYDSAWWMPWACGSGIGPRIRYPTTFTRPREQSRIVSQTISGASRQFDCSRSGLV